MRTRFVLLQTMSRERKLCLDREYPSFAPIYRARVDANFTQIARRTRTARGWREAINILADTRPEKRVNVLVINSRERACSERKERKKGESREATKYKNQTRTKKTTTDAGCVHILFTPSY